MYSTYVIFTTKLYIMWYSDLLYPGVYSLNHGLNFRYTTLNDCRRRGSVTVSPGRVVMSSRGGLAPQNDDLCRPRQYSSAGAAVKSSSFCLSACTSQIFLTVVWYSSSSCSGFVEKRPTRGKSKIRAKTSSCVPRRFDVFWCCIHEIFDSFAVA